MSPIHCQTEGRHLMSFFVKKERIMPKTKLQSIFFTAMMVFCMVYCMTCYTLSLKSGSFSYLIMKTAICEMWPEYIIIFCLVFFFVTKSAMKLAFRLVTPGKDKPVFITLAIQCMTVCLMVPSATLIVTLLHMGLATSVFTIWIQNLVLCFPMALCLQLFFAGPLVRFVFRTVIKSYETIHSHSAENPVDNDTAA